MLLSKVIWSRRTAAAFQNLHFSRFLCINLIISPIFEVFCGWTRLNRATYTADILLNLIILSSQPNQVWGVILLLNTHKSQEVFLVCLWSSSVSWLQLWPANESQLGAAVCFKCSDYEALCDLRTPSEKDHSRSLQSRSKLMGVRGQFWQQVLFVILHSVIKYSGPTLQSALMVSGLYFVSELGLFRTGVGCLFSELILPETDKLAPGVTTASPLLFSSPALACHWPGIVSGLFCLNCPLKSSLICTSRNIQDDHHWKEGLIYSKEINQCSSGQLLLSVQRLVIIRLDTSPDLRRHA